jgi:hypothetical protein
MDSFSTINFWYKSKSDDVVTQGPVNEENGGGSGKGYCVVTREIVVDMPVNEENGGGSGKGYCVVA